MRLPMIITAQPARRAGYLHTIVDKTIGEVRVDSGGIKFTVLSKSDPGISSGLYNLVVQITKEEAFKLFEAAVSVESSIKFSELQEEITVLKEQLSNLD
jgi:hypothetical protein